MPGQPPTGDGARTPRPQPLRSLRSCRSGWTGWLLSVLDKPVPVRVSPNTWNLINWSAAEVALGDIVAETIDFLRDRLQTEKEIMALLPVGILGEIAELKTPVKVGGKSLDDRQEILSRFFQAAGIAKGALGSQVKG